MLLDWNETIASNIADSCDITLSKRHLDVVHTFRRLYLLNNRHPSTRVLIKALRDGEQTQTMLELMQLFGDRPLRTLSYIAGLPEPLHCI